MMSTRFLAEPSLLSRLVRRPAMGRKPTNDMVWPANPRRLFLLGGGMDDYPMRKPCEQCGQQRGILEVSGPHYKVSCKSCGAYEYFAPKAEAERYIERSN